MLGRSASWTVACIATLVACGGQSLDHGAGSGGTASVGGASGSGGSPGSGMSGSSGSAGRGRGGSAHGGSLNVAGTGVGGNAGSLTSGGSGPLAGQAGATSDECSLPLDTGPCDAAFTRYGFNPETRRCESFWYGGCEGNANNFETFDACLQACGPADESGCPSAMPAPESACSGPAQPCNYSGSSGCLCEPVSQSQCVDLTSSCLPELDVIPPGGGAAGACSEPGCVEAIVIITYYTCTCDSTWACLAGAATGGPP